MLKYALWAEKWHKLRCELTPHFMLLWWWPWSWCWCLPCYDNRTVMTRALMLMLVLWPLRWHKSHRTSHDIVAKKPPQGDEQRINGTQVILSLSTNELSMKIKRTGKSYLNFVQAWWKAENMLPKWIFQIFLQGEESSIMRLSPVHNPPVAIWQVLNLLPLKHPALTIAQMYNVVCNRPPPTIWLQHLFFFPQLA